MSYKKSGITFVDGMSVRKPKEGVPEWIILQISFEVSKFAKFVKEHEKRGWVSVELRKSKEGKLYLALNDWEPKKTGNRDDQEIERDMEKEPEGFERDRIKPENLPF